MRLGFVKILSAVAFTLILTLSWRSAGYTKPADAKKTNKSCVYCHTKYGSKELTEAGKYYKVNGTLDGYKPSK